MEHVVTLLFLLLLQLVLGFDNLLYISLESKRAPVEEQSRVRRIGIAVAIGARLALLFVLIKLIDLVQDPFVQFHGDWFAGSINLHAVIVLGGGVFIMYTAMKEIWHMVHLGGHAGDDAADQEPKSANQVIATIVVMNLVFSFDSILSAMALTKVFWVMATAIVIGGVMMIWLSDRVSAFLAKNRMYEVLGMFVLLIVGVMLLSEGGHLAHLHLFGHPVEAMSKTTFYFSIAVLVLTDLVQSRFQRKLLAEKQAQAAALEAAQRG
ncbi:MAG: tellurium resistance protein TerC [Myxococcales bacterium]|nr:tellurium resistance protein TerC [Myxococcales bacterium]